MALVLADRVLETTTSTGSGTITLAGIEPGYQSFSAVGDGNQTYYTIAGEIEWEVGIGTYTASGTTLSRDTVLASSASGAKVTFSAGTKKVFVTYPSEKSVNFGISGNISALSGVITDVADPVVGSDAANKLYVDTLAAQGISYHEPVKYEVPNTTGNLTVTYNNGSSGVGATLTNAGSLVPFIPDGVTASISDRVLIYNQTSAFQNGVYTVTTVGDGSTAWVLTRATDADSYGVKSPTELGGGDAFFVTSGNTGAGETYVCNNPSIIIFGSTAITFAQISSAQVYSAGTGISLTNTTISLVSPVAVATGGTGLTTSPTNGQLLIGNGTGYTLSTLTAGSGVSITNSAGSITLSTTGSGSVTSVTATGPLASSGGATPDISIANSTGTGSVVLDQGATISSATITAAVSASITTITGTSANITTVTGTTAGFSSAAITQLSGTSAGITTVSGTTTTFSSGTITQFGATSATIGTVSGTNVTYSNGNFTSATITNLALTSLVLSNLSIGSANVTTLTGTNLTFTSGTVTNLNSTSANITTLTGTTFGTTGTTQLRGASGAITTLTGTTATYTTFNGSLNGNASTATTASNVNNGTLTMNVSGTGLSGSQTFTANQSTNATFTVTSNATSANTASTIVARDASGNFSAGTITATLNGNASTATSATSATTADQIDSWAFRNTGSNSGTAADSLDSNGVTYVNTNISLFGQSDGALYSQAYSSSWQHQIFGDYRTGQIAIRGKNSGTWQSWRTVLDSTNYTSYAMAGAGYSANQNLNTTSGPTFGDIYNNGWFRNQGNTGWYSQTYGWGLWWTTSSGATYGNVDTYGLGRNSWTGYSTVAQFYLMARSSTDIGMYDAGFGWLWYSTYGSGRLSVGTSTTNATYRLYVEGNTYSNGRYDDAYGNVRNVPSYGTVTSAYTITTNDLGRFVTIGSGGSVVVPNSTFAAGNVISVYNDTTGTATITLNTSTAYVSGTNTTRASCTLASRGVATILFLSSTYCVVAGNVT